MFHSEKKAGDWTLRLTPNQSDFFGADIHFDDDVNQPVRYESDFVTFKPNTDIVVNATTYSPDGQPQKQWPYSVHMTDPEGVELNQASLWISGPHDWNHGALWVGRCLSRMLAPIAQ